MKLGRWPCQELNQERIGAEFACAVAGQEQITTHTLMILVRTTVAIRENPRALMINFSWGEVTGEVNQGDLEIPLSKRTRERADE